MEQVVLTFTIILWSSVKYALGAGIALYANIGLLPSISLTVGGGMLGIICFTYFGSKVRKFINNHTPHNKLRINKKTRMMVRVKNSFGLPGIAFLTPVLLSIPVGVLMATALTSNKQRIFSTMFISLLFWSSILFIPYYALGIDIQAWMKDIILP